MKKELDNSVGIICGRFQVNELHHAHHKLIETVIKKHKNHIIFIGISKLTGSIKNPLNFETRKMMIEKDYPNSLILPLPDCEDDLKWSIQMDSRIREVYENGEVHLYGGRDSFIPSYFGKFKTIELEEHTTISGTELRNNIYLSPLDTKDFRSGIIYNSYNNDNNKFTKSHVTILIYNEELDKYLYRKKDTNEIYLPSGYILKSDQSLEYGCSRILNELIEQDIYKANFKYVESKTYQEWSDKDSNIITSVFEVKIKSIDSKIENKFKWI